MTVYTGREWEGYSHDPASQPDPEQNRAHDTASPPAKYPEPTPLFRPKADAKPFPMTELGVLAPAASAIVKITSAPPALAAQSVLAAASLATQTHADVQTLDATKPLSLFFVSVAESGERKSACDRLALDGVRQFEQTREDSYGQAYQVYQDAVALYESGRRSILSSRQGQAAQKADLLDLGPEPRQPVAPQMLLSDPTIEGLLKHLEIAQPSLGIFSDEGGMFLAGHGMNSDHRIKTATALSKIWGGDPINRTRAGTGPSRTFRGCRIACHLMVQPRLANQFLADEGLRDQGLLSRTLLAWPQSTIGTRTIPLDGPKDFTSEYETLARFNDRITDLMVRGLPEGPPQPLDLKTLRLTAEARALLAAFYNHVEPLQAQGGALESIRGFASKAVEQAARIAGILQLFDDLTAESVSGETMAQAISLMNWYLSEAKRLLEVSGVPEPVRQAEALRLWILSRWKEPWIDVRSIVRRGPGAVRNTTLARQAIRLLEENGWLVPEPGTHVIDGVRSRTCWRIVRP